MHIGDFIWVSEAQILFFNRPKHIFGSDTYQPTDIFDTEYQMTWQHTVGEAEKKNKKKIHFFSPLLSSHRENVETLFLLQNHKLI